MVLSAGSVVAGYTIEGVLGAGGMGTVYRARNPSLPRSDALKVLSAELSQGEHFRARFEREAELAATLDHPNIVAVYSRGETDGHLWIAMQYVDGNDADNELAAGRMTPRRTVAVITEVAKALDYAHRRQLLHRDVKPANFLLAANDERIFLADFGIARALDEAAGLTQTGMVVASVAYAAPESLAGEPVDHRADIYSLGCSLYRMLTGKAPYARSGGMAAMAAAHLYEAPPRVTDVTPSLPAAFDTVIARAMAKDPGDRYQSAGELAAAAARALNETTDAVRVTPGTGPPPRPWAPERTPPQWSVTPPGARPGGTDSHVSSQPPPPRSAPSYDGALQFPSPTAHPGRRGRALALAGGVVVLVVAVVLGVLWWPTGDDATASYQPQTLVHQMGSTEISSEPRAVAAAGPGDGDAVLSLGVQPAAVVAAGGSLPSWEQSLATGDVRVLSKATAAEIGAVTPGLIIDTSASMDKATYDGLAKIAPTITRPPNVTEWTWQTQLEWIGRVLGRSDKAQQLVDGAAARQADLRTKHPAFNGKSIEVITVGDTGVAAALSTSSAARYLVGLGFRYPTDLTPTARETDTARAVPNPEDLNATPTDVRIVVRTDATAGGGNYNGLAPAFSAYRGTTVIVDDPAVIAALDSPGYSATEYLDTELVTALSRQIR